MKAVIKLSSPATREFWEIAVLYEDEHLLAVNKPAGLPASSDRYNVERPNLMQLLHEAIATGKPWATERKLTYLSNTHRLDSEICGAFLLAKSKPVMVTLANLFNSDKPARMFLALAQGEPANERFSVDAKLAPHPTKAGLMHVDQKLGKKSQTQFEVLEQFSGYTLFKCEPVPGRTHQIRAHLRHARLPVVGDKLYGGRPLLLSRLKPNYRLKEGKTERPLLSRPALHAERLALPHPVTDEPLTITAPWPRDMTVALKYLRQFGK